MAKNFNGILFVINFKKKYGIPECIELSFEEIENLGESKLRSSAYDHDEYWNFSGRYNGGFPTRVLNGLGYKMIPDRLRKRVLFTKINNSVIKDIKQNQDNNLETKNKPLNKKNSSDKIEIVNKNLTFDEQLIYSAKCYFNIAKVDPNHRFLSANHCHNAFKHKYSLNDEQLALHLAFYLASWGMQRNSWLLWKDYKFHVELVQILISKQYDCLWEFNPIDRDDEELEYIVDKMWELSQKINSCCIKHTYIDPKKMSEPKQIHHLSDTLITKILFGTLMCIPALDRYVRKGLKCPSNIFKKKESFQKFIKNLFNFIEMHKDALTTIMLENSDVPIMRAVDASLWMKELD